MINKIKAYISTRPNLFKFIGFVLIIISIIIIATLTSTKPTTTKQTTPGETLSTPTPIVQSTDPLANPDQTLTISGWNEFKLNLPENLPSYQITQPLITTTLINQMSTQFKFTSAEKQKTLLTTSYLWSNPNQTFFASTKDRKIFYQLLNNPSEGTLPNSNDAITFTQSFIQNLFSSSGLTFTPYQKVNYLLQKESSYLKTTDQSTANFAEVSFSQTLNNYPILSENYPQGTINFLINRQKQIASIDIKGGYQKTVFTSSKPIISLDVLSKTAHQSAKRIYSSTADALESKLLATDQLTLKLSGISLAYFPLNNPDILEPVFVLEGTLTGNKIPSGQAIYVVSATSTPE